MVERRYERLFGRELEERMAERALVYLPIGILERHGEHLPFGLDAAKATGVCLRAAEKLGGVVVPAQHLAGVHNPWGDDLGEMRRLQREVKDFYLSPGIYTAWLLEVLEGLALMGFRAVAVYTGHYPQWQLVFLDRAVDAFNASREDCRAIVVREQDCCEGGDHGGKWETSLMMAAQPAAVDLGQLEVDSSYPGLGCGVNAVESSRAQGEAWVDACAAAIADEARRLIESHPEMP